MMKKRAISVLLSAGILLQGCVSLLPETAPPKPRYQILSASVDDQPDASVAWSLVVDDPRTTRVFDSVRVPVKTGPGKIEYFSGAEWADRAPRLFQIALIQTFQDTGRILAVGDVGAVPLNDYTLKTEIRDASLVIDNGTSNVSVTIFARMSDNRGNVQAVRKFQSVEPTNAKEPDNVMQAYNDAFTKVIAEITAWTFVEGEKAAAPSPAS